MSVTALPEIANWRRIVIANCFAAPARSPVRSAARYTAIVILSNAPIAEHASAKDVPPETRSRMRCTIGRCAGEIAEATTSNASTKGTPRESNWANCVFSSAWSFSLSLEPAETAAHSGSSHALSGTRRSRLS